jgi:hypothetical protein
LENIKIDVSNSRFIEKKLDRPCSLWGIPVVSMVKGDESGIFTPGEVFFSSDAVNQAYLYLYIDEDNV